MGVYIKGLKMPKDCEACPFWEGEVNGCPITHYFTIRRKGVDRPEWCPLLPVPDHGDLIDRDALMSHKGSAYDIDGHELYAVGTGTILRMPVIIPAERSEDD